MKFHLKNKKEPFTGPKSTVIILLWLLEERGCILTEINGEPDHIHVLFDAGPEVNLLDLVRVIKTKTSRFARSRCKEHVAKYYWKPVFWSDSYFITTVGENTKQVVQEYIKHPGGR